MMKRVFSLAGAAYKLAPESRSVPATGRLKIPLDYAVAPALADYGNSINTTRPAERTVDVESHCALDPDPLIRSKRVGQSR